MSDDKSLPATATGAAQGASRLAGRRMLGGTSAETWDRVLAVNLRSHFLVARHALPKLPPGGSLVFLGSVAGLRPGSFVPAYDSSKAALLGLCRHVALEGARRGVRANVLAPGLIDTRSGGSRRRCARAGRARRSRSAVRGRRGRSPTWPCSCSRTRPA